MSERKTWTTSDEIEFLKGLAVNDRSAYRKYAKIIAGGLREWDPGMNVGRIRRVAKQLSNAILRDDLEAVIRRMGVEE